MTKLMLALAGLMPVLFPSCQVAGGGPMNCSEVDWPQWRGPGRDAISAEVDLLREWPACGPEALWRIDVGPGYSGVAAMSDRLYTMWDEAETQVLVCLDAADGELLWSTPLGEAFEHSYGNGPRSTPLVDGDLVFAIGTSGRLLAANRHTGQPVWERDLVREFGARLPAYGYSSSPLLAGNRLFVETAGESAAYSAFDPRTGALLWSVPGDPPAYSSPVLAALGGVEQVLFWSSEGVRSVAPRTGESLWSFTWRTNCPATGDPLGTGTPLFLAPDRLFLSSGTGAGVLRISRRGREFRVDLEWKSGVLRNDVNSSVLLGEHVYGFDGGTLACVDVRTGEATWEYRGFRKGSLIAAGDKLIVLGEKGELALVDVDPEAFVLRSSAQVLRGRSWTAPALAGGRLYLRNHEELVCLDLRR